MRQDLEKAIDELEKLALQSERTNDSAKRVLAKLEQEQYKIRSKICELRLKE